MFVGVVSAESGLNNYVGSDKSGWGYLANKAIWHNKGKVGSRCSIDFRPHLRLTEAGLLGSCFVKMYSTLNGGYELMPACWTGTIIRRAF